MGYYASGSGDATIKEGRAEELCSLLESKKVEIEWDVFEKNSCISFWLSDDHWHAEETGDFLNLLCPFITEGTLEMSGEDDCHWRYVFNLESKCWREEFGTIVYERTPNEVPCRDLPGAIDDLIKAWENLQTVIDRVDEESDVNDYIAKDYPFSKSFGDFTFDLLTWKTSIETSVKDLPGVTE